MTFAAALPALLGAGSSLLAGYLGRDEGKSSNQTITNKYEPTPFDKKKLELIDQLLASVNGNGPYSDLFKTDEAAFQKSFVEPAKSLYKNQIAPQIQQSYIASGQQRGTGMEDQLLRAGIDLDQLLNQNYLNYSQLGQDRMSQVLNSILGAQGPQGTTTQTMTSSTPGETNPWGKAFGGYLSGGGAADLYKAFTKDTNNSSTTANTGAPRAGFKNDFKLPEFDYYLR